MRRCSSCSVSVITRFPQSGVISAAASGSIAPGSGAMLSGARTRPLDLCLRPSSRAIAEPIEPLQGRYGRLLRSARGQPPRGSGAVVPKRRSRHGYHRHPDQSRRVGRLTRQGKRSARQSSSPVAWKAWRFSGVSRIVGSGRSDREARRLPSKTVWLGGRSRLASASARKSARVLCTRLTALDVDDRPWTPTRRSQRRCTSGGGSPRAAQSAPTRLTSSMKASSST